jgi:hypothetical protein
MAKLFRPWAGAPAQGVGHVVLSGTPASGGPALADLAGDFPALSGLGIVDGPALGAFVRQALMQPGPRLRQTWHPINLEIWVRAYSKRDP